MTEQQLRQKVVNAAASWLRYNDTDGSRKKIIDLYYAHKPLVFGYDVKDTEVWCTAFVAAVAIKAGVTDILPLEFGCQKMMEFYQKEGYWQEGNAYTPAAGDVVFYNWDSSGVGIVVDTVGSKIEIIEGGKNGTVAYRTMTVNGKYIRGYGTPDYARKAVGPAAVAIRKLYTIGVIDSPHYWTQAVTTGALKHLDTLLIRAAEKIVTAGPKSSTPENGIGNLLAAGVINTPDYWLANYRTLPKLGTLLCALGGAVKQN